MRQRCEMSVSLGYLLNIKEHKMCVHTMKTSAYSKIEILWFVLQRKHVNGCWFEACTGELQGGEGSYGGGIKIHRSSALSLSCYESCCGNLLRSEPHTPTLLNYATREYSVWREAQNAVFLFSVPLTCLSEPSLCVTWVWQHFLYNVEETWINMTEKSKIFNKYFYLFNAPIHTCKPLNLFRLL